MVQEKIKTPKGVKIAILNIYQGRVGRGAETFIDELTKRLSLNNQVDILSGNQGALVRWPILWRLFLDPTSIAILVFTLKNIPKIWREKYDFVIPTNGGWQALIIRLVTWTYGGGVIISGQSGIGWDDRVNLWSYPNYFVGISTKAANWAKRVNPFIKSLYIPNGVDLKKFTPQCLPYNLNLKKPIILCVSALTKSKNVELVIKAMERVENASLLLVGDGYLREDLKMLGRKLLNDRFELKTFPHDQMPGIYGCADLFVLVSNEREAFGIVYVEAMASGLPVIARDDEQRREIVGNAGILIENPIDIGQLSLKIKKALNTDWDNNPRIQAEKFDWDIIAEKYEKLLLGNN